MLGEKIKKYLSENGIKQTFVSEKVGIPDPAFSDVLSGKRKITAIEYYRLCKTLKVPMEFFLEDEEGDD